MDKTIYCSECLRRGLQPKKLGVVEDIERVDGRLRLWCKQCQSEIRVTIHDGLIKTEYASQKRNV